MSQQHPRTAQQRWPIRPNQPDRPDRSAREGTRAKRIVAGVGAGLLLAGTVVLGYVAWQFWGTSWLSQRAQQEVVEQTRAAWTAGREAPSAPDAPERGGSAQGGSAVHPRPSADPASTAMALIRIPAFGPDYQVPLLAGTGGAVLAKGFGHYAGSAEPGAVGNFAVTGHRVTHGEPLRDMPHLVPGDEVVVETERAVHTYRLVTAGDALSVRFDDVWVLDAIPANPDPHGVQPPSEPGQRLLTLTTCAELFHTDERLVAFGVLESTTAKT